MKQIEIGKDKIKVPAIGLGCMRITGRDKKEAEALIKTAMENGAKRALIPLENKRNFNEVSGEIVERVDPIFYGDPQSAAIKSMSLS